MFNVLWFGNGFIFFKVHAIQGGGWNRWTEIIFWQEISMIWIIWNVLKDQRSSLKWSVIFWPITIHPEVSGNWWNWIVHVPKRWIFLVRNKNYIFQWYSMAGIQSWCNLNGSLFWFIFLFANFKHIVFIKIEP